MSDLINLVMPLAYLVTIALGIIHQNGSKGVNVNTIIFSFLWNIAQVDTVKPTFTIN